MIGPNNITRAIIDSTVDRSIREIAEDPQRSIRKLADLARQLNKGKYVSEWYTIVQELLRDDDCPYYTGIEHLLRNTDRKAMKNFGINIGYNSLSYGGKIIREIRNKKNLDVPWTLMLRLNPENVNSFTLSEMEDCINQGRRIGIYTYFLQCKGLSGYLKTVASVLRRYNDCAFFCFLADESLSAEQIALLKPVKNTMFLLPVRGSHTEETVRIMRKMKILCSLSDTYDEQTAADWISLKNFERCNRYECAFLLLRSSDDCPREIQNQVAALTRKIRLEARYPYIPIELFEDALLVDQINNVNPGFLEITENGDIHTAQGFFHDFRHTTCLERLIQIANKYAASYKADNKNT